MTVNRKRTPPPRRNIKSRLLPLVLAIVMMMALLVPGMVANAAEMDEPPTIIINAPAGMMFEDGYDFFEAYKIFDVTFSGDNYSYVIVPEFAAFDGYPGSDDGVTLQEYLDSMPSATEMMELAAAMHNYIYDGTYGTWPITQIATPVGDVTITDSAATIDLDVQDGGYGYYLVFHSIGAYPEWEEWSEEYYAYTHLVAACMLTTTNPVADVTAKIDIPTINKYIVNKDGSYTKNQGFSVGDIVDFAIEVMLPSSFDGYDDEYTFIVHDWPQSNYSVPFGYNDHVSGEYILFENFSLSIWKTGELTTKETFPSAGYELEQSNYNFSINFDFDALRNIPEGYSILIEYSTKLNSSFSYPTDHDGAGGEHRNVAFIEFSSDPYNLENTQFTPESSVKVSTGAIPWHLRKVDGDSWNDEYEEYDTYLFGAEFSMYRLTERETPGAEGILYDLTKLLFTDTMHPGMALYDGIRYESYLPENEEWYDYVVRDILGVEPYTELDIWGIGPGLYMLKEVKAPNGYNLMTYNIFLEITFEYGPVEQYNGLEVGHFVYKVYYDVNNEFLFSANPVTFKTFCDMFAYDHSSEEPEEWIDGISETIYIENFSGTLFPGTGGPGTAIFSASSVLLTFGLVVFYATNRKKERQMGK